MGMSHMNSTLAKKSVSKGGHSADHPLVSVMIPTFNQAEFLPEAVESALAQDYPNLEIVICDDASTDETPDVIKDFLQDKRVRYFRNPQNIGRVANYRHILYDLARGSWVINLDGDDLFISHSYISHAVELTVTDPNIVLVFGKAKMGRNIEDETIPLNACTTLPQVMNGTTFFLENPPFETIAPLHATCLYHRDSALKIGFYEKDIRSTDFESLYRLMLGKQIGYVDKFAALWRQHDANLTASASFDDLCRNIAVFDGPFERARELNCVSNARLLRWRRHRYARYFLSSLMQMARGRVPPNAVLRLAVFIFRRNPTAILAVPGMAIQACRDLGNR